MKAPQMKIKRKKGHQFYQQHLKQERTDQADVL